MAAYTKTAWVDGSAPAISAANLGKIESGVQGAIGLDALADLRALPVPTLVFTVRILGHTSAGDGGGGVFRWDAASSATDNDGTTITPNSSPANGRWKRLYNGYLKPEWFGAKGDGVASDVAAINALVGSVSDGDRVAMKLTSGKVYRLDSAISTGPIASKNIDIIGYGAKIHLTDNGSVNIRNHNVVFDGVHFTQDPAIAKTKDSAALDILNVRDVTVRDCIFDTIKYKAIQIRGDGTSTSPKKITIDNCTFIKCSSNDITIQGFDATDIVKDVIITGCKHEAPDDPLNPGATQIRAIHVISNAKHVTISDCQIYGVANAGYTLGWRDAIMIGNSSATNRPENIIVSNCQITGGSDDCVGISGAINVTVDGCILYDSKVTSGVYVPGDGTWSNDNVTVSDCTIFGHPLAGVFLKDTLNYSVTGNIIYDCKNGVHAVDNGVGVLGGAISDNYIRNVTHNAISAEGTILCKGNTIDGFGDAGSGTVTDKDAIRVTLPGVYQGNHIKNGPIAFLYNGNPQNFVVSGNTGSGVTEVHQFTGFGGDRFVIADNVIAFTGNLFLNQPAASATKVYRYNI